MIDNYFQRIYALLILLAGTMILLIGLLFFEYRFLCNQARDLLVLKQHYYGYIRDITQKESGSSVEGNVDTEAVVIDSGDSDVAMTAEEISIAQASDDPDDDDDYIDESFIIINRQPEYLKQSTMDYLQAQELDSLMTTIDMDQWSHYTDQKIVPMQEKKPAKIGPVAAPKRTTQNVSIKKPIKDFGLAWPIEKDKFWLSSLFGPRKRTNGTWGFHHGIDMAAVKGTMVKAARSGQVIEASFQAGYGNTVVVQHTAHVKTRYAHLHAIRVRTGQVIQAGAIVGTVGETGFIRKKGKDGSHLHFEVYEKGKRVNPLHCLPRTS
jgi:murein DD-endopeptidase MepM/ murein hydrolase activator NlpD